MAETRRFLRFAGRLWENMEFEPEAGWETETIDARPGGDPAYQVVLRDGEGQMLVAVSPGLGRDECRVLGGGMRYEQLLAYVPLHPDGESLELRRGELVLYRTELSRRRPSIRIVELATHDDGSVRLAWESEHDRPLTFQVVFVDGRGRAFTVARGLKQSELTLDTAPYPGGEACRLAILATDGLRSAHAVSEPFAVPDKPPRVVLISPAEGEALAPDQPVTLVGQALDLAGASLPDERLRWLVDGRPVARGSRLALCEPLEPGDHRVTLSIEGDDDARAEVAVRVRERTAAEERWRQEAAELGLLDDGT